MTTRERVLALVAAVGLLAGGWWLSANTEWVDVDSPRPARGEARDQPLYAFEQLLRRLGMTVKRVQAFDSLPPERARLLLLSNDWELLPGRAQALQDWVRRGGHLLLLQGTDWDETALAKWVPIEAAQLRRGVPPASPASAASANTLSATPPLWGDMHQIDSCASLPATRRLILNPRQPVLLSLDGPWGPRGLRVAVGQGTVTVLDLQRVALNNDQILRCDMPLLLAGALQAEPGATAWIYLNETRQALLPWLWQEGRVAVLAFAAALAAALWRGAVRFGPRQAPATRLRRSIAEQVRGLGAWLRREGRESLLEAQQRALNETAARRLPGYRKLDPLARAAAIAAATGQPADALATALQTRHCTRAQLPARLHTLEAARRALLLLSDERRPKTP